MKKCPKCGKAYDDTWKVCLDCRAELKEIVALNEAEVEAAKAAMDSFDDIIGDTTGDMRHILAGGHIGIEEVHKLLDELTKEIQPDYDRNDVSAVHTFYIINAAAMFLIQVDIAIFIEIQHSDNHKEGCGIIRGIIKTAHEATLTKEATIKAFSISKGRKVRSLANRIGHCFGEYHRALDFVEKSIDNALKWEAKNQNKKK